MKKILFLFCVLGMALAASAQSMEVVIDGEGTVVGRFLADDGTNYMVEFQDIFNVPKAGHSVVRYSAENGQGVIFPSKVGKLNVRSTPSTSGVIVGKIFYEEGDVPPSYPCLGKENGWYKTEIDGKIGYVREDLVNWEGYDSF